MPTFLEAKCDAEDRVFSLAFQINKYIKRGKAVPEDLLFAFGLAWQAKEQTLAAFIANSQKIEALRASRQQ